MPKRPPFTGIHEYPPAEGGKPEGGGKYPPYGEDPFQRIMDVNWVTTPVPPIPPIPPVVVPPYVESVHIYDRVGSFNALTPFLGVEIGQPAADRLLIIFAGAVQTTGFVPTRTLISVAVNGDPMTLVGQVANNLGPGLVTSSHSMGVAYKSFPEGSTADVEVRWSLTSPQFWIAIYALRGLDFDGFNAFEANATFTIDPTVKIDVPENGLVLACNCEHGPNQVTMAWTGVTANVDERPPTTGMNTWVAGADATELEAELQRVVTATSTRINTNKSLIAVSWKGLINS